MSTATPTRSVSGRDRHASDPIRDAELRREISDGLRAGGFASLEVAVGGGHVTLSGRVSTDYERQTAQMTVRRVSGVERISSLIRVAPPQAPKRTAGQRAAEIGGDLWGQLAGWFSETPKTAWAVILLGALMPMTMFSCSPSEQRVPVQPVSGKVSYGGEAPVGAQVVLHPVGHQLPKDVAPSGHVGADGSFQITSYVKGDGAPSGDYAVTVLWFKSVKTEGGSGPGPNVLPREYSAAATSPFKATVKAGGTILDPIDIPKK